MLPLSETILDTADTRSRTTSQEAGIAEMASNSARSVTNDHTEATEQGIQNLEVTEQSLEDRIRAGLCESYDGGEFLPADSIEALTARDIVKSHLSKYSGLHELCSGTSLESIVEYIVDPAKPAKKLFLALAYCEELGKLRSLQDAGFRDEDLPIATEKKISAQGKIFYSVRTLKSKKFWSVFSTWRNRDLELFHVQQWCFLAPVFTSTDFDYELDQNCPLPIVKQIEHQKGGFFSSVFEVEIHEAHQKVLDKVNIPSKEYWRNVLTFIRYKGNTKGLLRRRCDLAWMTISRKRLLLSASFESSSTTT